MSNINEVEFERGIQDCRIGKPAKLNASESYNLGFGEEYSYQEMATARTGS